MDLVQYSVTVEDPRTHNLRVQVAMEGVPSPTRLTVPSWTPGSYLMREFARQIHGLQAVDADGNTLPATKVAKGTWEVEHNGEFSVSYNLNAQELSVRTPYLDHEYGFFVGANVFAYVEGETDRRCQVSFSLPESWQAWGSDLDDFKGLQFETSNYEVLADAAIALSPDDTPCFHFEVLGKPHAFMICGEGTLNPDDVLPEIAQSIERCAELFDGDLPYEQYLFILVMTGEYRGGLEHANSSALAYPRTKFGTREDHQDFLLLAIHEFFHVWNVKRIRTDVLGPFDYAAENYTRDLWVAEGWTSYYQSRLALDIGVLNRKDFYAYWSKRLDRHEQLPGRLVQSLDEASFDAWIKLYRKDGNSPNTTISYYLKGSIVAMLLDLEIRRRTHEQKSLDDVLHHLWTEYGVKGLGYPEGSVQAQVEHVVGSDFGGFFERHVHQAVPVDYSLFDFVGLELVETNGEDVVPSLGLNIASGTKVTTVHAGGPAECAGVMHGDELVAVNGYRVRDGQLDRVLRNVELGDPVQLTWFHQDRLRDGTCVLTQRGPRRLELREIANPSPTQQKSLDQWLGAEQ